MNCSKAARLMALYVEGDLPHAEALERHLAECEACRGVLDALRDSQKAVRSLAAQPVGSDVLEAIRSRVLAEVSAPPPRGLVWWWWQPSLAAAAVLLAVLLWPAPVPPPPLPPALRASAPPPLPEPQPRPVIPRRSKPLVAKAEPPEPPLMMKIETDDPGIVIYWIVEGKPKGD